MKMFFLNNRLIGYLILMIVALNWSCSCYKKINTYNKKQEKEGLWVNVVDDDVEIIEYKNGKKHGVYKVYYKNGSLKINGEYRDDKPHGTWFYYNDNGSPMKEIIFDRKGEPHLLRIYNPMF